LKRKTVNIPDEELEWIEENIRTKIFHREAEKLGP